MLGDRKRSRADWLYVISLLGLTGALAASLIIFIWMMVLLLTMASA